MTDILPFYNVKNVYRFLRSNMVVVSSPFSGATQVQDWGGRYWDYKINYQPMKIEKARIFESIFNECQRIKPFVFQDPTIKRINALNTNVRANGSFGSGATEIELVGFPAGSLVEKGDFFSIGSLADARLYQVSVQEVANSNGDITLKITPHLRKSITSGHVVNFNNPQIALRLEKNFSISLGKGNIANLSFNAVEAI